MSFSWRLHQFRQLRDFLQLGNVHRDLETLFASFLEQLLGLVDVALALLLAGVEEFVHRSDRVIVADVATTGQDRVDQRLTVNTQGDCLAYLDIGEVPSRVFIQI